MTWTNFIVIILVIYVSYYALNVIYDLFIKRNVTKTLSDDNVLSFSETYTATVVEPEIKEKVIARKVIEPEITEKLIETKVNDFGLRKTINDSYSEKELRWEQDSEDTEELEELDIVSTVITETIGAILDIDQLKFARDNELILRKSQMVF